MSVFLIFHATQYKKHVLISHGATGYPSKAGLTRAEWLQSGQGLFIIPKQLLQLAEGGCCGGLVPIIHFLWGTQELSSWWPLGTRQQHIPEGFA